MFRTFTLYTTGDLKTNYTQHVFRTFTLFRTGDFKIEFYTQQNNPIGNSDLSMLIFRYCQVSYINGLGATPVLHTTKPHGIYSPFPSTTLSLFTSESEKYTIFYYMYPRIN